MARCATGRVGDIYFDYADVIDVDAMLWWAVWCWYGPVGIW